MRRLLLGPLAVLVLALLCATAVSAVLGGTAADLPYAGTWKVTVLNKDTEISFWILKISKDARKIEVVNGIGKWQEAKFADVQADATALRADVRQSPLGAFSLVAYAKRGKDGSLAGSIRQSFDRFIRFRMTRTEEKMLDPEKSLKPMAGAQDYVRAVQAPQPAKQIKALQDLLEDHTGKPITYLASQVLLSHLISQKAGADRIKPVTEVYLEQVKPFGHEITIGAHHDLARMLLPHDRTRSLALAEARKAASLLRKEDPRGLQLAVYVTLVRVLEQTGKNDEVNGVIEKITRTAADALAANKTQAARVAVAELVSRLLLTSSNAAVSDLGLEYARKAVTLARDEKPARRLSVYLSLVQALEMKKKGSEARSLLTAISKAADEAITEADTLPRKTDTAQFIAQLLLNSPNARVSNLGLDFAWKTVKLARKDKSVGRQLAAHKLLHEALKYRGKKEEAADLVPMIEKLEDEYDDEYARQNLPFKATRYAGRKGKSNRVVLVELFTGATCPPCIAADMAFDAALQSYSAREVVFLQYHLHIPRPDTLTNADSEARSEFYNVQSTPTMLVDGDEVRDVGGLRDDAKESHDKLRDRIGQNLEKDAAARLDLEVTRKGDRIDISAVVAGLKEPSNKLRLRFALVEERVRYVSSNQQRLHHHIVRAMPGGAKGLELDRKSGKYTTSIDLAELRKKLNKDLDDYVKENPKNPFPNPSRPMAMKKLTIVAFIQDGAGNKKVYQAAQATVPEAKNR